MSRRNYKKHILLSISIMVSGREETMGKCIASLERLRRRVPCELILTDTGCSEEAQEWLRRKADKVIPFSWCNDFAAARNVGLKAASGLWFMFLDDDEWFEDTREIENFFLTGEYKRYNSASYIVRNYANMEGTLWRDTALRRMTRIRENTQFFYPIHEVLWPVIDPSKKLGDYAHHYGYAAADPEKQMEKRHRNLSILLPELEREPQCMHHYLQAVAEYLAMDSYEEAYEIAERGIGNCDFSRGDNEKFIDALYAASVRMRGRAGLYEEAAEKGKVYLENAALSDLAKASIQGDLAIAYGELNDAGACREYLKEYLRWKKYFAENREKWGEQETLILDSCFENYQYRKAVGWGFCAALSLGDIKWAEELLSREPLEWWLDAVQNWYTRASVSKREKWQHDFKSLVSDSIRMESADGGVGRETAERWSGECTKVKQLYDILTMPEPGKAESEQENVLEEETESLADGYGQEMEALAAQLKEKVKVLIAQNQQQAALAVIKQLRGFFPEDKELDVLQGECG